MAHRTICITGAQSCTLLRTARIGKVLRVIPCDESAVAQLDPTIHGLADLHLGKLCDLLHVDTSHPLNMLVPTAQSRCWGKGIQSHVLSASLPGGAFLQLTSGEDEASAIKLPDDVRILIESPSLALLQAASSLQRRVTLKSMTKQAALLRLLEFADECCGWYIRDPHNPRMGPISYDEPQKCTRLTEPEQLKSFINSAKGIDGVAYARLAVRHVIDGTGSPMEAYLHHSLCLPPRLGGLSMSMPLANTELQTDDATRSKLKHKTIRPDLQWPKQKTLAEYLGDKEHAGRPARIEDKDRMQDYMIAGYKAFPLMFDDIKSATALGRTAQMIARELMRNGVHEELYHVRKLLNDPDFVALQGTLIATLLPPITRYDSMV